MRGERLCSPRSIHYTLGGQLAALILDHQVFNLTTKTTLI